MNARKQFRYPVTNLSHAALAVIFIASCSTIPKGAPQDFSHAEKEIKAAKKENTADLMPKTLRAAEKKLDEASAEWRKPDNEKSREAATAKARDAGHMAEEARKASSKVREWDKDIDMFTAENEQKAESAVANVTPTPEEGIAFNKSIAYFNIGSARLSPEGKAAVRELAETLRKDPGATVVVRGHADGSGPMKFNAHLCYKRAEAVRKELESHGIRSKRITLEPAGPGMMAGRMIDRRMMGPGHMQLQRRVDIEVKTGFAH
ncbi:MAG: hypothetical protein RIQ81_267 [Pseudomonadota bacterium]|jgi:outer membrane protein OmpA-like peptidoglycan-associated protein